MSIATLRPGYFDPRFSPPASKLLDWTFEEADEAAGRIVLSFDGKPEFANPAGHIQGGFLAAMLDDTIGPAVVVASRGAAYAPTIQLNVQFLKPVKPGRIRVEGVCTRLGRTIAFCEGRLFDSDGELSATATSSSRVTTFEKVRAG